MDIIDDNKDNNLNLSNDKNMELLLELFKKTNLEKESSSANDNEFKLPLKERLKKKIKISKPNKRKYNYPKDSFSEEISKEKNNGK